MNAKHRATNTLFAVFSALSLLASTNLSASHLLTDNIERNGPAAYPWTTSQVETAGSISTGATFTFLSDEAAGFGVGNTDPDIIKFPTKKLQDGYNERVGSTAIYGAWTSKYGATILIDLQQAYSVDQVTCSIRANGGRGVGTFLVLVSDDGTNFTPLGIWDGSKAILDSGESDSSRNVEISVKSAEPVQARYVKVFLSHWDETHTSRLYKQLIIGELAVWGESL